MSETSIPIGLNKKKHSIKYIQFDICKHSFFLKNKTEKQVFQTLKREHQWGEKGEMNVKIIAIVTN